MEHAKKMVPIPSESVERFQRNISSAVVSSESSNENNEKSTSAPISRLETEMRNILSSPDLDDSTRLKLYQQILQRFLYFAEDSRKPLRLDLHTLRDNSNSAGGVAERASEISSDKQQLIAKIASTVSKKYQTKAELLLKHLAEYPLRFSGDSRGAVTIDSVAIPGTNIVNLVNDTVRSRKGFQPHGRHAYARFLQSINVPREYVGNVNVWKNAQAISPSSAVAPTPRSIAKRQRTPHGSRDAGSSSGEYSDKVSNGSVESGDDSFFSLSKDRRTAEIPETTSKQPSSWLSSGLRK